MTTPTPAPGASRRTVLRTAVHAAWAVPAIQLAAAAPAFASSSSVTLDPAASTVTTSGKALAITVTAEGLVPQGTTLMLRFAETYFPVGNHNVPMVPQVLMGTAPGWVLTNNFVTDAATGTRYIVLTAGSAATSTPRVEFLYDNNSINVGSLNGTITATVQAPDSAADTIVIRA